MKVSFKKEEDSFGNINKKEADDYKNNANIQNGVKNDYDDIATFTPVNVNKPEFNHSHLELQYKKVCNEVDVLLKKKGWM